MCLPGALPRQGDQLRAQVDSTTHDSVQFEQLWGSSAGEFATGT